MGAAGKLLAVGDCGKLMNGAVQADLHLSLSGTLAGNAQINLACFVEALVDVDGAVGLQALCLFANEEEEAYKANAYYDGNDIEQPFLSDEVAERNARPAEAEEEIDDAAHGEEREAASKVHGVAVEVVAKTKVEVVVHAYQREQGLYQEYEGTDAGASPEYLHRGVERGKPIQDCFHNNIYMC